MTENDAPQAEANEARSAHFINVRRGEWLQADLRLDLERHTDRAGNVLAVLTVFLAPGTHIGGTPGQVVVLDEPAPVRFYLDPAHLALVAWNAQRAKSRSCKRGPLEAHALRNPKTRTEATK